jgi:hypothetical protein
MFEYRVIEEEEAERTEGVQLGTVTMLFSYGRWVLM